MRLRQQKKSEGLAAQEKLEQEKLVAKQKLEAEKAHSKWLEEKRAACDLDRERKRNLEVKTICDILRMQYLEDLEEKKAHKARLVEEKRVDAQTSARKRKLAKQRKA